VDERDTPDDGMTEESEALAADRVDSAEAGGALMEEIRAGQGESIDGDEARRLAVEEQHAARRNAVSRFRGFAAGEATLASEQARADERTNEARREAGRRPE
jgi:hypothetical protein